MLLGVIPTKIPCLAPLKHSIVIKLFFVVCFEMTTPHLYIYIFFHAEHQTGHPPCNQTPLEREAPEKDQCRRYHWYLVHCSWRHCIGKVLLSFVQVEVIAGKDQGKQGKVLLVDRKLNRVLIEGVNFVFILFHSNKEICVITRGNATFAEQIPKLVVFTMWSHLFPIQMYSWSILQQSTIQVALFLTTQETNKSKDRLSR